MIRCKDVYLYWFTLRTRDIGSFMALFTDNYIKLDNLSISYTSHSFSWVVARNSCLQGVIDLC